MTRPDPALPCLLVLTSAIWLAIWLRAGFTPPPHPTTTDQSGYVTNFHLIP